MNAINKHTTYYATRKFISARYNGVSCSLRGVGPKAHLHKNKIHLKVTRSNTLPLHETPYPYLGWYIYLIKM